MDYQKGFTEVHGLLLEDCRTFWKGKFLADNQLADPASERIYEIFCILAVFHRGPCIMTGNVHGTNVRIRRRI